MEPRGPRGSPQSPIDDANLDVFPAIVDYFDGQNRTGRQTQKTDNHLRLFYQRKSDQKLSRLNDKIVLILVYLFYFSELNDFDAEQETTTSFGDGSPAFCK